MNGNGPNGHIPPNNSWPTPQQNQVAISLQTYEASRQAIERERQALRDAELRLHVSELQNEIAFHGYQNFMQRCVLI
jgi:hypothetical protein